MERCRPVSIPGIGVGAVFEQELDGQRLRSRIPAVCARRPDGRGMQWFATASIPCTNIGPRVKEWTDHQMSIGRRGDMQRGVTLVDVKSNGLQVVGARGSTCRAARERKASQARRSSQRGAETRVVIGDDYVNEPTQWPISVLAHGVHSVTPVAAWY